MEKEEKDLSVDKEVLYWLVDGVHADTMNYAIEHKDGSLNSRMSDIMSLRRNIREATTKEELAAVDKKLKAYYAMLTDDNEMER